MFPCLVVNSISGPTATLFCPSRNRLAPSYALFLEEVLLCCLHFFVIHVNTIPTVLDIGVEKRRFQVLTTLPSASHLPTNESAPWPHELSGAPELCAT